VADCNHRCWTGDGDRRDVQEIQAPQGELSEQLAQSLCQLSCRTPADRLSLGAPDVPFLRHTLPRVTRLPDSIGELYLERSRRFRPTDFC
jgi:hypothetical protein